VVNRRAPLELYENVTKDAGNWLTVELSGNDNNVNAIGSFIEVRAGGALHTREVTIGGGHAGGQLLAQHFGLGAATKAEVQITAPDGTLAMKWAPLTINANCQFDFSTTALSCQPAQTN
ncbi:MAG: ASPIC/UnbV domain-containing protein, partial [Pseudomonadota bacterium]